MSLFSMFSNDLGVDLGTSNVLIYADGKGIVVREPSVVAVDRNTGKILQVGAAARNMLGRTPGNVVAMHPLKDGIVSDHEMTVRMLQEMFKTATKAGLFTPKPRVVVSVPSGVSEVEERSVINAAIEAGARRVFLIEEPLAAGLGAGLDIRGASGHMVVDIGGGTTDIAVLSMNGVAVSSSLKIAGNYFDEMIIRYVRRQHGVVIGQVTAESVKKERGIIDQEIGMNEDAPDSVIFENLVKAMYREHPIRVPILGTGETIREITPEVLYTCHRAFYAPGNMLLCVVGDVDPEEVLRAAREVLPRESGPAIPRDYGREEDLTPHMARIEDRMEVAMPTFLLGFKCPPVPEGEERMRLDILGDLACDVLMGESSPLFTRLYSQGLINGTFDSAYDLLPGAAYVFCGGDSNDPEAVQQAVLDEARRVVREGVDPAYVQRIRRASFGASIKSLNSFEAIASTAAEGCFQGYDPFRFPEVYDSITQQDLLDFIRDNIRPERMALSIIYPKE